LTGNRDLTPEDRLNAISLEENQGGELQTKDYVGNPDVSGYQKNNQSRFLINF
jgi:hypothetical protein